MSIDRETYFKFKPMADDLRQAEHWDDLDGVLNRNKTVQNLYKMGYRKQSEGEWSHKDKCGLSLKGYMACSLCNVMIPTCDDDRYCLDRLYYCPNCGAHMKGGAE